MNSKQKNLKQGGVFLSIGENFLNLRNEIPKEVTLIAVSKTRSNNEIMDVYECGCRDFGENKVQELMQKYEDLPKDIRWHLIGHLQRNKVKYLVGKVHLIHSLDSIRLLEEIEKQFGKNKEVAKVLIQINIGEEDSKTGIDIENLQGLIEECEKCNNVKVEGLMATIPIGDESSCKYYFTKMNDIFKEIKSKKYKNIEMKTLSIGMSGDYGTAIECGSNLVRIGEGIFGKRNYNI